MVSAANDPRGIKGQEEEEQENITVAGSREDDVNVRGDEIMYAMERRRTATKRYYPYDVYTAIK